MKEVTRREFAALGAVGLASAAFGPGTLAFAQTAAAASDTLRFVHPELRTAVQAFQQRMAPPTSPPPPPPPRPAQAAPAGGMMPGRMPPEWVERKIPGRDGAPDVRIYVYGAKPGQSRPGILHMHGGGYTGGAPGISLAQLRAVTSVLDCAVVTVDYRLAPGTPFPGSLEDNYAALLWLHANSDELGVDRSRIAVMGESAGGGHAAMLTIAARDRREVPIAFQALVYPMIDDRTGSTRQAAPHVGTFIWNAESNRRGWSALLGMPAGSATVPPGSVPSRLDNFAGLPPAYIAVGSIDLFVDEDVDYAQRLMQAGVSVELNVVPGAFHGFDIIAPGTNLTKAFLTRLAQSVASGLAPA